MNKFKLINSKTKEEHLCDKVTIDGFDYYIPNKLLSELNQNLKVGDVIYSTLYGLGKIIRDYGGDDSERNRPLIAEFINSTTQQMYHRSGIWQLGKYKDVLSHNAKKVLCGNNPNIDIPKVVNEVEKIADEWFLINGYNQFDYIHSHRIPDAITTNKLFKTGYNKSQETHPNSDENMIEFYKWVNQPHPEDNRQPSAVYVKNIDMWWYNHKKYTSKELLKIWKEQQPKKIYYE